MKKYLMLYAFLMTALSLFAREDRVGNFEQLMRLPRIAETDMVSYPGGKCMMYRLYLRDKDLSHTPFSVSRPADFSLSPFHRAQKEAESAHRCYRSACGSCL